MKVSRTSWHYRLHSFISSIWFHGWDALPVPDSPNKRRDFEPGSLCSYFWSTFFLVLTSPVLMVAALIVALIVAICWLVYWLIYKPWMKFVREPWKKRRADYFAQKRIADAKKPPKDPNMLVVFVKAKKRKVCPTITLVD